jgi:hypothetical protein
VNEQDWLALFNVVTDPYKKKIQEQEQIIKNLTKSKEKEGKK